MKSIRRFGVMLIALLLAACMSQTEYVRPIAVTPGAYKENKSWKLAEPKDAESRAKWWTIFNDSLLNYLEEQVSVSNQNVAQAEARYRQARALVDSARAANYPTVSGNAAATRARSSSAAQVIAREATDNYRASVDAAWEIDLWGRVRDSVRANLASAQAGTADIESMRLSQQAQLAQSYFQLRALDAQKLLFDETIAGYEKSLRLTQNQYASGVVAKADVILAQTTLRAAQAQVTDLGVQRAQLEHALAVLIGMPASTFSLEPITLFMPPPEVPVGVPSQLLERRPDIAAAERRVAAANAQIRVARSAYFPSLTVSASSGFQSTTLTDLLSLPNRFWSLGPALALSLFDGGTRRARSDQAMAIYDGDVAAYRQTVLVGLQEVEDQLSSLRILAEEAKTQEDAAQLARQSVVLVTNQYRSGIVNYANVVAVQASALNNERNTVEILGRRLVATVQLIKALGGGWGASAQ